MNDAAWRRAALALGVAVLAFVPGRAVAQNITCITFSDCDDGLFCTVDDCVFFICIHTARCSDDSNPCTQDCSESQNTCVNHIPVPELILPHGSQLDTAKVSGKRC